MSLSLLVLAQRLCSFLPNGSGSVRLWLGADGGVHQDALHGASGGGLNGGLGSHTSQFMQQEEPLLAFFSSVQ